MKYRLDRNNEFHRIIVHQIIQEFSSSQDANFDIKLSDRLKKSQGKSVNLPYGQNILPRREPVYFPGINPLKDILIIYGADSMSRKDIYKLINPSFE